MHLEKTIADCLNDLRVKSRMLIIEQTKMSNSFREVSLECLDNAQIELKHACIFGRNRSPTESYFKVEVSRGVFSKVVISKSFSTVHLVDYLGWDYVFNKLF